MTLAQLRIFVSIAEHGSVRAAARALGMAQSSLTLQLSKLEAELGAPLFQRGSRGIAPTLLGEHLRGRAAGILADCERTRDELRQLQGDFTGTLSFGMAVEPLTALLPSVLPDFRRRFARMSLHLVSATSRVLLQWVRDGTIDMALALIAPDADAADLRVERLHCSTPAVICRKGDPLSAAGSIRALRDAAWITTRAPQAHGTEPNRLSQLFAANGLGQPDIALTTEALYDTLHLLAHSDYLALEPAMLVEHVFFREHLTRLPIAEVAAPLDVCVVQRATVPPTPAAQALASMLSSCARVLQTRATTHER